MPTLLEIDEQTAQDDVAEPKRPRKKKGAGAARARATAESMAQKQREISVSEFFAKTRHLLGFDNPRKALLTTVKEAVDNALDACEEAGILPDIEVRIEHLADIGENRYRITIEDNGPGIVRKQIDNIFGRLLYGSKFHRLKMSRGQQGIGISAAGMYGLMTTGKPMVITSRPKKGKPAHHVELAMDTTKNRPEVTVDVETDDFPAHTGTRVAIELEGRYMRGRTSVDEYLEQTAIANPHAQIVYSPPAKTSAEEGDAPALVEDDGPDLASLAETATVGGAIVYPRTVNELPPEPVEIKPHPRGVELGALIRMLKQSEHNQLGGFLTSEFSLVSPRVSQEIVKKAGLTTRTWINSIGHSEAEAIFKAIQKVKIQGPPLNCLAPIGPKQILAGLLKGVRAEFYTASSRPPAVYRGNPFQIEVGVAFGGDLPSEELGRVIRFANRVPLLYQQSACSAFKAVLETGWRNYGLSQSRGAPPQGPLVIMIHMASVWVPFTSESKEAIADYDEIRKEMRLALQECGRKLATYVRKRQRMRREGQRRDIFQRYIGEVVRALHTIDEDIDPKRVYEDLHAVAASRTAFADVELDEDGNPVEKPARTPSEDGDTIVVEARMSGAGDDADDDPAPAPPPPPRKKKRKRKGATNGAPKRRRSGGDSGLFEG
ncbi:MAG: DNA topoisomerase VI subunit B [Phycisphaerales bacterium]